MKQQISTKSKTHAVDRLRASINSLHKKYVSEDSIPITIWQDNDNKEFAINEICSYVIHSLSAHNLIFTNYNYYNTTCASSSCSITTNL